MKDTGGKRGADARPFEKPRGRRVDPTEGGYTYFGQVFDRFLDSRGYNQSTFAAECRRRGYKVGRPESQRDLGQRSVSDWMRGKTACPREVPAYADAILDFTEEERGEFGLAYAYGQTVWEEEYREYPGFWEFYRKEKEIEKAREG